MKKNRRFWIVSTMLGVILPLNSCEKVKDNFLSDPGTMVEYRDHVGVLNEFRITGAIDGSIWGGVDGFYTDDSDLSTAAVHAGKLNVGQRDVVKVRMYAGRDEYFGSTQNGVTSDDYGSWVGTYAFE